jgi:hypothetical protein
VLWSLWGCTIGQPMGKLDRPPAAAIITPEDGAVLMESVELVGKVVDPDGLDDLVSVSWRSDLDGELGEAPPDDDGYTRLTTSLSAGIHTLELSVTDSTELEARADITVTVGIPCVEGVLELVPEGPDTQIHVFGAPDPDGVWVAWNQPDGAGLFDVWVQHLGCDGQVDVGPLQLDDGADNEIDPAVAVSGNRVLVAWQSDNGLGQDNLDVRWRLLGREGVLGPVQEALVPHNALMPKVVATSGGWRLAAVHAREAVFEVFTLELDPEGLPVGEAVDVEADPGSGETWPALTEEHLAWEVDGQVVLEGTVLGDGHAPSISGRWVGWSDDAGDLWTNRIGGAPVRLRGGDNVQHSLSLVGLSEGGLVGWMVNEGGLANRVVVGRFDEAGELLDQVDLGTETAAPYGLQLAQVTDSVVFVGWSEGTSPDFRAMGAFVSLP